MCQVKKAVKLRYEEAPYLAITWSYVGTDCRNVKMKVCIHVNYICTKQRVMHAKT